jgi:hypothetical protein
MTLTCEEHNNSHAFKGNDSVFCVTNEATEAFTAVCQSVIKAIPRRLRSSGRIKGGVDIHIGHSRPYGPSGELSVLDLRLGAHQFSITRETALRYLPNTIQNRRY